MSQVRVLPEEPLRRYVRHLAGITQKVEYLGATETVVGSIPTARSEPVAQSGEHPIFNRKVVGSIPTRFTNLPD